jgi:hypothetical protein
MAPMPQKFETLAVYNAEVARGIVHTAEWDARMAELQQEFGQWQQPSDEDRIREAMGEAQDHPGRVITR